jgi:hypothetical protein
VLDIQVLWLNLYLHLLVTSFGLSKSISKALAFPLAPKY